MKKKIQQIQDSIVSLPRIKDDPTYVMLALRDAIYDLAEEMKKLATD